MAWTGEEGRRVLLPTAQNVRFPMVSARFSVNCVRSCFLPRLKRWFSIGFIRFSGVRVSLLTFSANGPRNPSPFHVI